MFVVVMECVVAGFMDCVMVNESSLYHAYIFLEELEDTYRQTI